MINLLFFLPSATFASLAHCFSSSHFFLRRSLAVVESLPLLATRSHDSCVALPLPFRHLQFYTLVKSPSVGSSYPDFLEHCATFFSSKKWPFFFVICLKLFWFLTLRKKTFFLCACSYSSLGSYGRLKIGIVGKFATGLFLKWKDILFVEHGCILYSWTSVLPGVKVS